jgi:hypothetical protein
MTVQVTSNPHEKRDFDDLAFVKHRTNVHGSAHRSWDDISVAGLGWFSVSGQGPKAFDVHVPEGVKVFRRPSMLPFELINNGGATKFSHRLRARGAGMARKKRKRMDSVREGGGEVGTSEIGRGTELRGATRDRGEELEERDGVVEVDL